MQYSENEDSSSPLCLRVC